MIPKSAKQRRWDDAVGVLPLEDVLAQEHEFIHGDRPTAPLTAKAVEFDDDQIIDPVGFTDRLLRAWEVIEASRGRPSLMIDTRAPLSDQPSLDAVADYIVRSPGADRRPAVERALKDCADARLAMDSRTETSDIVEQSEAAAQPPASLVRTADARLITAIVPQLNALLTIRLDEEPAFRPFVNQGTVAALGNRTDATDLIANRLLLEAAFPGLVRRLQDVRLDTVYDAVRRRDTTALCLSGGGIRSATFANGVLRGLAKHGLLGRFDYLSTVSGGGYAGSWLSAWMHHAGAPEVQQQLAKASQDKLAPEPPPMQHLRAFSHFLTPRVGFFSTDTWTLGTTIGRNMIFNWAVLLPLMAAALLVPRYMLALVGVDYCNVMGWYRPYALFMLWALTTVGVGALVYALRYLHRNRPDDEDALGEPAVRRARAGMQGDFIGRCFIPLVASAVLLTIQFYLWWRWSADVADLEYGRRCAEGTLRAVRTIAIDPITQTPSVTGTILLNRDPAYALLLLGGLSHLGGWALSGRPRRHLGELVLVIISGAVAGIVALFMVTWFVTLPDTMSRDRIYTTLAPPALLSVLLLGSQLFTALTSRRANDAEREWVARFNAWLLIAIVMWIGACVAVLYGPEWVEKGWSKLTLLAVGGGSGILGLLVARSGSSASVAPPPRLASLGKKAALALAAPLFATSIIIGLAAFNEALIEKTCSVPGVSNVLACRARPLDGDAFSHSQPFIVRARHLTNNLNAAAERFASTGADRMLASVFTSAAADASAASARNVRSAAHWDSVVHETHRRATEAITRTEAADEALGQRMRDFTEAVLAADSAIAGAIGDPEHRDALLKDRMKAVRRVGGLLRIRRTRRDEAAIAMDTSLTRLAALDARADVTPGVVRSDTLAQLRTIVDGRLRRSIELFSSIRADSDTMTKSQQRVVREIAEAGVVPSEGAVPLTIMLIFGALVVVGMAFGSAIDTNKFSLRAMYEMRLVRAYLGASRPPAERRPNPFTGFDPLDDIPMGSLWPNWGRTPEVVKDGRTTGAGRSPTSPPFHVVNTTLNLVAGANLAWQQRKAESMTISPLHAGSAFIGYRATSRNALPADKRNEQHQLYGGKHGVTLGTAVTISGAAASPNAGALSSPVATFLMTFFNARLGAWLGNPGRTGAKTYHLSTPHQIVRPILAEMFGQTTDRSPYVALSDGGHFENLALYEMVLRRCRLIVVSDAGCDPNARFDDLGNAVRKIRIDLGVPIEFPDGVNIHSRNNPPATGGDYWAIGRIRYSAVDHGADAAHTDGVLIYIKPALYGREPSDVQQYARMSDTFPHESTADQFFSESQFESYRALGEFIVTKLVEGPLSARTDIESNNTESLLAHWADLRNGAVLTPDTTLMEGSAWQTSAEKRTG